MTKEEFLKKYEQSEGSFFEENLLDLYSSSIVTNDKLKYAYEYVLDLLKEVCQERNISYNSNKEELFINMLEKCNKNFIFQDLLEKYSFDYKFFADPDKIENFLEKQINNCKTADDLETFWGDFGFIIDEFRTFFVEYFTSHLFSDLYQLDRDRKQDTQEPEEWMINDPSIQLDNLNDNNNSSEFDVWDDDDWDDVEWDGTWGEEEFAEVVPSEHYELTDEIIKSYIEFILTAYFVNAVYVDSKMISNKIFDQIRKMRLQEFMDNPEFMKDLKRIMNHNRSEHIFHYHGTQDGDIMEIAEKIINEGLLMTRDLSSTSNPEFDIEDFLLYKRGFGGEIGKNAIVIIDQPIIDGNPMDITEELTGDEGYTFVSSGLQGLDNKPNYIIRPEYIVGYVNKLDKKVVFNPLYYRYVELMEKGHEI